MFELLTIIVKFAAIENRINYLFMALVRPKKNLGQHFLTDQNIAQNIVEALMVKSPDSVLEIGPGMGVLTQYLIQKDIDLKVIEIDKESVAYLSDKYEELENRIIDGDFLKLPVDKVFDGSFSVIGNFPYNISSQIFFKILENKERIPLSVGMIQKEVAERIASPHGNKSYGILSVLLQTYYNIEYLFTVGEGVFNPPPKVKSAVIRLERNNRVDIGCPDKFFKRVIKAAFNQRRKTMRNSLKQIIGDSGFTHEWLGRRPEQMSVEDFIEFSCLLYKAFETV